MTPLADFEKALRDARAKCDRAMNAPKGHEFRATGYLAWLVPIFAAYGLFSFVLDVAGFFLD